MNIESRAMNAKPSRPSEVRNAVVPGRQVRRWALAVFLLMPFGLVLDAAAGVCAEVQLEIKQELTVERQGFDARMTIYNGLDPFSMSNVNIQVNFLNATGGVVAASSNPAHTNALFFIRVESMENILSVSNGVIAPGLAAEIHWLIIPAPGAGGSNALGKAYFIGATLQYRLRGQVASIDVNPDRITVRPMPKLALDYFMPIYVYGDDPWTPQTEEVVPFSLGLRVRNSGAGPARQLKVESAQPRIVENRQGLLVSLELLGCEVHDQPVAKSLLADFGTLEAGSAAVARWTMAASLMGRFTNFTASFTHADELGGELTSLIESLRTHTLLRNVRVDLPGRDPVLDFLAADMQVYESDGPDTAVRNVSANATLAQEASSSNSLDMLLQAPLSAVPFYVAKTCPAAGGKEVVSAVRLSDGKELDLANAWISKARDRGEDPWIYGLHLFDVDGGGTYRLKLRDLPHPRNRAPVLAPIGTHVAFVGEILAFPVVASDPDGTIPELSVAGCPSTAVFADQGGGEAGFSWQPQAGDYGVHPVRFAAADGEFVVWEIVRIYVGQPGEELCNGLPCSLEGWEPQIADLWASSRTNKSIVWLDSVEGLFYEIFTVDDPFSPVASWARVGRRQEGTGALDDVEDPSISTNDARRFYRAVLAGDEPNERNIWGVIRRDVKPGFTLVAPPVRTDRRFDGEMGAVLAEMLHGNDGGIGSGADEVYLLQADGSWRMLYLDAARTWREADGTASGHELPAGQGFMVARKRGAPARITFAGPVGNDGTRTNRLVPGWNLIGLSEGKDLPLKQTLAGANPTGGNCEEDADQLVLQNPDGTWRRLMYVQGWGAPCDGNWFDLRTFLIVPTNEVLKPGAAYYYLRRGQATDLRF